MPLPDGPAKDLAALVATLAHQQKLREAAAAIADICQLDLVIKDDAPAVVLPVLQSYLHSLMESDGMEEAAQILWTPNQFNPNPHSVRQVWNLFDTADMGLIMGAAKMGKSFSMGVRLFLEWVRDPEWTSIRVVGPSEDHLEQNLFSHIVALHNNATLPMPGSVGDLFIGLDRRNQLSSIRGVVIPKGNTQKSGRLQGGHRRPRTNPHPKFGPLSRLYVFLDEIENIPGGIWSDIDNVISEIEKGGLGFKIFCAYNPVNQTNEVGKRAEPPFGWGDLDEDEHFRWKSTRGWDVLRIDAEQCENVRAGHIVYSGLQTKEGLEMIAKNAGGRDQPGYLTMGRGLYPKIGVSAVVVPPGQLTRMKGDFIWYDEPQPVGSVDLALEGGDDCVYTLGKWGKASGVMFPPSREFPQGQRIMFKDPRGQVTPRWALQAEMQFVLPKGDTVAMEKTVMETNRKAGVRPEFFACDRTGSGSGVADLLKNNWSFAIHDVNYSGGSSKEKLMTEDTKTCEEEYSRMDSELWFALRMWGEFGYFMLSPKMEFSKLTQQLTNRRYHTANGKKKVEKKGDYEVRNSGASPNEADSLTLLVHAARKGSGVVFSMKGGDVPARNPWDDDWPQEGMNNGVRIDESNRSDFLDDRAGMGDPIL